MCFYGEGYGAKIQKGGGNYIPDGVDFILFDIKIGNFWLDFKDVQDIGKQFGLDTVPTIGVGTLRDLVHIIKDGPFYSEVAAWKSSDEYFAEGIVARPLVELYDKLGRRVITKLKYRDFHSPQAKPDIPREMPPYAGKRLQHEEASKITGVNTNPSEEEQGIEFKPGFFSMEGESKSGRTSCKVALETTRKGERDFDGPEAYGINPDEEAARDAAEGDFYAEQAEMEAVGAAAEAEAKWADEGGQ